MTHQELIQTPEYWISCIQYEFFYKITEYLEENKMSRTDLANQLGVSKSYITQILNGNAKMSLEKMIEISLAIGFYPKFLLAPIDKENAESRSKVEELLEHIKQLTSEYKNQASTIWPSEVGEKIEEDIYRSINSDYEIVA